jgi:zinc-finger of transposase IS204/IS1001/IS1096/IS1165
VHDIYEREVRDLPCMEFQTTVVIELYRLRCGDCGVKAGKVEQLPSKAPFSKRFEEAVGRACESAAGRQVAGQWGAGVEHGASDGFKVSESVGGGAKEARPCGRWEWMRSIWVRSRSL